MQMDVVSWPELQAFYAERVALHQHQRETLGQFHQSLIVEVDAFLKQTRSHQQKVWQEQGQERAAYIAALRDYVAALRDYVWG